MNWGPVTNQIEYNRGGACPGSGVARVASGVARVVRGMQPCNELPNLVSQELWRCNEEPLPAMTLSRQPEPSRLRRGPLHRKDLELARSPPLHGPGISAVHAKIALGNDIARGLTPRARNQRCDQDDMEKVLRAKAQYSEPSCVPRLRHPGSSQPRGGLFIR